VVDAPSRRDRVRAATIEEIKQTARQLLVAEGPDAVSLRAIGRAMGMTAPALYRYFGSRDDLVKHVCGDIFTEIADDIHAAIVAAGEATGGDMTAKIIAACEEFRRWALAHKPEFGLLFGTPLPGLEAVHDDFVDESASKFSDEFMTLFYAIWRKQPFRVPADDEIEPGLAAQLARYRDALGVDLPVGAVLTFLRCWVRLYGMVSLEVFGHLGFALEDPAAMFEYTLAELAELLGLHYTPNHDPGPGAVRNAPPGGAPRPR
jgi:AcrR family transcriptional regulator